MFAIQHSIGDVMQDHGRPLIIATIARIQSVWVHAPATPAMQMRKNGATTDYGAI